MTKRLAAYVTLCVMFIALAVCASAAPQKKSAPAKKTPSQKSPPDTITFTGVKDLRTLKDGAYEANGFYTKASYRSYAFQKRGSALMGYAADSSGVWCFQGSFAGTVISISDAVNWDDEYDDHGRQTGKYGFSPLKEYQKPDFVSARISDEIRTFPVRRIGWMTTHPDIIARDERWMNGCLKYYSEPHVVVEQPEEPPPCGDEALRGTDKNEGTGPKYHYSSTICTITDKPQTVGLLPVRGGVCSVDSVFDVLVRTPSAIAPTLDDKQPVKNCGLLNLLSVTSPNQIKVEIDEENHRVLNYTLPGHRFYPGRVIRQIVEEHGEVKVITTGTGTLAWLKNTDNQVESVPIWLGVDQRLKVIFAREYKPDDD